MFAQPADKPLEKAYSDIEGGWAGGAIRSTPPKHPSSSWVV